MAMGSTQSLTEICNKNLLVGKRRPDRKADSLISICEPIVQKMCEPRHPKTYEHPRRLTGIALPFSFYGRRFHGKLKKLNVLKLCTIVTHLQIVPRSGKRRFMYSLPHTSSWRSAYFFLWGGTLATLGPFFRSPRFRFLRSLCFKSPRSL
jgi:hypothetical protein